MVEWPKPKTLYRENGSVVETIVVGCYCDDDGPDDHPLFFIHDVETPLGQSELRPVRWQEGVFKVMKTGELLFAEPPRAAPRGSTPPD